MGLFKKLFGDYSSREIKRVIPIQKQVLALEEEYKALNKGCVKLHILRI